jgi:2-amino-4-hydroxy-6-hydroxymethyldihydropteridine diphosphokinase
MHVALSLGSNLGDREDHLRRGLQAIDTVEEVRLEAWSHCYETEPVGPPGQPGFLNLAAICETNLTPKAFLAAMFRIELDHGRTRQKRWQPRALDIDIILWGDAVIDEPDIHVPHREFRTRSFVLTPLADIASEMMDPVSGMTIAQLAEVGEGAVDKRCKLDL